MPVANQLHTDKAPSVFTATSTHDYLRKYCEWRKCQNSSFSVRALAKKLEFNSHSLLAMIIRGERVPRLETLKLISDYIGLSETEYEYLQNLLLFQKAKSTKEKLRLGMILTKQRPAGDELVLEVDGLAIFERWYHIAILEMTLIKPFHPDPAWIAQQLGPTINASMVLDAVDRLVRSGQLERREDGSLRKTAHVIKTPPRVTTAAMRSYQKQMLQRAATSLEGQAVAQRLFMNTMIPFNSQETEQAKDMLADFIEKFRSRFSTINGDCVYYLGSQFFYVTKPAPNTHQANTLN